jgi:toxin-antitoxin system PIN domain toxin
MILPDVNVLVYAFRRDSTRHKEYRAWLQGIVDGPNAYGVSPQVLASVLRICTHPKVYRRPSTIAETLAFCGALLAPAHSTVIQPGERHWSIFTKLCESSKASGNLVQDAWFAALAIEHGCEWISTDGDYATFRGLRWQRPFD